MKKRINLTESQLHNVIRRCINEAMEDDMLEDSPEYRVNDKYYKYEVDAVRHNIRSHGGYEDCSKSFDNLNDAKNYIQDLIQQYGSTRLCWSSLSIKGWYETLGDDDWEYVMCYL